MNHSISIIFEEPEHGWLPVNFAYQDFHLDFAASDILNDPIEELYNILISYNSNEIQCVTWWLEPDAYFFEFKKEGIDFSLIISETANLNNANSPKKQLIKIIGSEQEIIEPMRTALKHFSSKIYEENHWPYNLEKRQNR